jgi:hypothetical protein
MITGSLSSTLTIIALAAARGISFVPEVVVRGDTVHLGDVADVSVLPENVRSRAEKLPLMRLPTNQKPLKLSGSEIAARARSLMPVLAPWFGSASGTVSIMRRNNDPMQIVANASQLGGIAKDDTVRVTIVAGIYTIERQAIAMSDAQIGERFFVKTQDRKVLSALCCEK